MDEHPLRQWLDANQRVGDLVGVALFDLEEAMAGRQLAQRHDLHLFCCVLAEMAEDLSAVTTTPSLVGAELAAEVYPIDADRSTITDVKRAALGTAIARAVGASFAGSEILATFYGVGAVAACPDPDNHPGIYECCDPAYSRMALHEVPTELQLLAGVARQITIVDEHRSPVPVLVHAPTRATANPKVAAPADDAALLDTRQRTRAGDLVAGVEKIMDDAIREIEEMVEHTLDTGTIADRRPAPEQATGEGAVTKIESHTDHHVPTIDVDDHPHPWDDDDHPHPWGSHSPWL